MFLMYFSNISTVLQNTKDCVSIKKIYLTLKMMDS